MSPHVSIDLNGFTLTGSGDNSGHGIYQEDTRRNLRVHNGKVVQWAGAFRRGVFAGGKNNQLDHIQAAANYDGIQAGNDDAQVVSSPGTGFVSTDPWANFSF